jgi:hypothetical protein
MPRLFTLAQIGPMIERLRDADDQDDCVCSGIGCGCEKSGGCGHILHGENATNAVKSMKHVCSKIACVEAVVASLSAFGLVALFRPFEKSSGYINAVELQAVKSAIAAKGAISTTNVEDVPNALGAKSSHKIGKNHFELRSIPQLALNVVEGVCWDRRLP